MHRPTPLYKVLYAPSRVLRAHNLEILVSTLNVNTANMLTTASTESSAESVLVPKLQATSARGTPVPYPVHKTLVVAEGLDSALAFGRFSSDSAEDMRNMVKVAVDLLRRRKRPLQMRKPRAQWSMSKLARKRWRASANLSQTRRYLNAAGSGAGCPRSPSGSLLTYSLLNRSSRL